MTKSMLYSRIEHERMMALREGDTFKKNLLTVFIGDIQSDEKRNTEITDDYIIRKIKKGNESANENARLTGDDKYTWEVEIMSEFLPKQLSDEDLKRTIDLIVDNQENANIGSVMKELNNRFSGRFEGKVASEYIKSLLN